MGECSPLYNSESAETDSGLEPEPVVGAAVPAAVERKTRRHT